MSRRNARPIREAIELLQDHSIVTAPVPVEDIARRLGIVIARTPFKGSQSGFALRDGDIQVIGVNSATSRRRQRFTIAHELGHLRLHRGKLIVDHAVRVNWRDDRSSLGTDDQEIEANTFAAELLMPESQVRDELHSVSRLDIDREGLISQMANTFDVSIEAMTYRLINLGLFVS